MAQKVRILVPGDDPVQIADSPQLRRLEQYGEVTLHTTRPADFEEQIARASGFQVILNSRGAVRWHRAELESLADLKMIATCSIGTDMIDLEVAGQRGIVVSNQPGRTAPVVAEHMFGMMFAAAKRMAFHTAEIRQGRWSMRMNAGIQGKVLGIVGTGNIGAEMARLGRAVGMEVIAWTFNPSDVRAKELGLRFVGFDELLKTADVVSLHVALTDDTHHLIGAPELGKMKSQALLLNGARGGVLDLDALAAALQSGAIAGAGLDVFPEEPFVSGHPIKACENVVFTPHAADQTPEGKELLNAGAVDNIIAFLEGNPRNDVAS